MIFQSFLCVILVALWRCSRSRKSVKKTTFFKFFLGNDSVTSSLFSVTMGDAKLKSADVERRFLELCEKNPAVILPVKLSLLRAHHIAGHIGGCCQGGFWRWWTSFMGDPPILTKSVIDKQKCQLMSGWLLPTLCLHRCGMLPWRVWKLVWILQGRIKILKQGSALYYSYVQQEEAAKYWVCLLPLLVGVLTRILFRFRGLTVEDLLVFQVVEQGAENGLCPKCISVKCILVTPSLGAWSREIRLKSNLQQNQLTKSLKVSS